MKKAGIITLYGEFNFGNRLQNYAVQEVLKKINLDVETIKLVGLRDTEIIIKAQKNKKRHERFRKFNEDNIKFANEIVYVEKNVSENFDKNFDYYVIGSDQIWNYNFDGVYSDKVYAGYANKNKVISFSASFGVSTLPEKGTKAYEITKNGLNNVSAISVREEAGLDIVKGMTGRDDAVVHIDPTMMLTASDWKKVMVKPAELKTDKFIVKSFLGETNDVASRELERLSKKLDCEIIDISDEESPYYCMGPAEFLYLFENAQMVMTDSFHACVFSILFNTPFFVFGRQEKNLANMNSRIDTLTSTFNLKERVIFDKIDDSLLEANYSHVDSILEKEREKVIDYLKENLK